MEEKAKSPEHKKKMDVTPKKGDGEPKEGSVMELTATKPHMGIPKAVFVEDVDAFMALPENNENADKVLKRFDEQHSKYKFMEFNLTAKKRRLKNQIPDFQKSIDMIQILANLENRKEELDTQFLLSEQVYMRASIPPTDKVLLWLGANVMLEYDLEEAMNLLKKNLSAAKKSLEIVENDLDFLRDQFTTTEQKVQTYKLRNHSQEIAPEPTLKAPPPTPCISLKQRSGSVPDIRITDIKKGKLLNANLYHRSPSHAVSYLYKTPKSTFDNDGKRSTSDHAMINKSDGQSGTWMVFCMSSCTSNLLHSVRQRLMSL